MWRTQGRALLGMEGFVHRFLLLVKREPLSIPALACRYDPELSFALAVRAYGARLAPK
jgi:hypothetical protein